MGCFATWIFPIHFLRQKVAIRKTLHKIFSAVDLRSSVSKKDYGSNFMDRLMEWYFHYFCHCSSQVFLYKVKHSINATDSSVTTLYLRQ
mmetsp:Transcript_8317/g.17251  ORF Transcript_8317/g.17251 Transcript_8317/m.17251 type:complete len:89 (+) Transcript_8317:1204-1470(+)